MTNHLGLFLSVIVHLACSTLCVEGRGRGNDSLLFHHLFEHYDSALRPVREHQDVLTVDFGVTLTHIVDMDEKHQTLSMNLWITMGWNDTHMRWDPGEYGGVAHLTVPATYVWKPDIILYENVDPQFNGWSRDETYVKIHQNGYVLWEIPAVTRSSCKFDVSSFPFDHQRCFLKFGPWIHSGYEVTMRSMAPEGSLEGFIDHAEWRVHNFIAEEHLIFYGEDFDISTPYADVTFTLRLGRKSTFYVFNLLLPCLLLTFIMAATFFMPIDSGEKLSFGVSILLAMVVFQLVLKEALPESETLPWIGRYVIITMILMAISLAMSVFIMNICDCTVSSTPVPNWAKRYILNYAARCLLMGDMSKMDAGVPRDTELLLGPPFQNGHSGSRKEPNILGCGLNSDAGRDGTEGGVVSLLISRLHGIEKQLETLKAYATQQERNWEIEKEWRTLAKVLDRIFMFLYVSVAITCLVAFAGTSKPQEGENK
ncbi:PREDICTED: neuronal acetylcholine receptor subunit alpha-10-like [Branchiostoma belcheri]|uniref:Neuronal acetylcholine receptor subunit alpha-10-like n=1 Tax=Branchiostoma belcheri TaxID=7741 RepID=A0A6P5AHU9_BRABE|nr:PREDICTED: neuronal acetylcholine receptor subunit alpha-10-like [Branchiostoma belcheri]